MWNYIKGLIRNGSLFSKLITAICAATVIIYFCAIMIDSGELDTMLFLGFAGSGILTYFGRTLKNSLAYVDTVPYWGNKFGREYCIKLLSEDRFVPFINSRGRKIRALKVSKSGRWFCIRGKYYPTYLVFDYDETTAKITMIDGTSLDVGDWKYDPELIEALNEYLGSNRSLKIDNENIITLSPSDFGRAFRRICPGNKEKLATADWDEIRYRWEKELSEIEVESLNRKSTKEHKLSLRKKDIAGEAVHNRVLMDSEIAEIADAIADGEIKGVSEWFVLDSYKDDMCVCNGVKILQQLGFPANKMATEFLFDCLRDLQKPYFEDAVKVLKKFSGDELIPQIEKHAEKAHAAEDVLWGAGLIYLSKEIGYEISLGRPRDDVYKIFHDAPEQAQQVAVRKF